MFYIVGLGNPGKEYEKSRHNAGRIMVEKFAKKYDADDFEFNKKANATIFNGKVGKEKFQIILPETFMNKSGLSVKYFIKNKKAAEKLIVLHDDLDIGIGNFKITVGRGAGGHKGVDSIINNIKTKDFVRIRVGISTLTVKGKTKRPAGDKFMDYVIKNFSPKDFDLLKKVTKEIISAIEVILEDGPQKAMSLYN